MMKTFFLSLLLVTSMASADVALKPTRLALFKNGYGFVTLSGDMGESARERLGPLPVPAVGTFWVSVGEGAQIRSLIAGQRHFPAADGRELDMGSLVSANPGRKVSISYENAGGEAGYATGTIVPLPQGQERQPGNVIGGVWKSSTAPVHSPLVMLRSENGGTLVVPTSNLLSLSFEGEFTLPVETEQRPAVDIELEAPAPGAPVEVTSLSSGIRWQPSYRFELGEEGRGALRAQATIVNNLMDIEKAQLELITGYPSLEHAQQPDPIALQAGMLRLVSGSGVLPRQVLMTNNNCAPAVPEAMSEDPSDDAAAPAEGVQTADLFFYPLADFSARAGEVVMRPLFSTPVDYRSVYIWEVGDPRSFVTSAPGEQRAPNEVWHCIRFHNPLPMPLTTATVEFLEQGRIAGTNTLAYTPAKQECTTRMNQAVNVPVQKESRLLSQKRTTLPNHGSVMENTSAVSLALVNGTGDAIDVEILQRLNGTVLDAGSGEVKVTGAFSGPSGSNPATIIRWKLHLEPGKRADVHYTYAFYR